MRMYLCFFVCMSKCNQWTLNKIERKTYVNSVFNIKNQALWTDILSIVTELTRTDRKQNFQIKIVSFFFLHHFCLDRHCKCSVLTIIHQKVFTWIRVSFSIPVFMFIFDPNKATILNDVLPGDSTENHPNRKKKSNKTQNVNWIQWFRGLDIVSR